jgi:outer membrane protein OmpA-like peptidoglycan-associated protein
MRGSVVAVSLCLTGALALTGCAKDEYGNPLPMTDTAKGGLIGGGAGAAIGALASHSPTGALIGAVGGGLVGALVGNYMDQQRKDLQKVLQPELNSGAIQIQVLPENRLLVSMTGDTAFDVNSAVVKPGFYSTMDKIAAVVNRYGKTQLVIVGHTDSTGSAQRNQVLSEQRAQAVDQYLLNKGVIPQRFTAYGVSSKYPRASNATPEGRALNRRVEIAIVPVVAKG